MAKLTAPLFSLGARGSLAKTLVYSVWKGVAYARAHVTPANPDTDDQKEVRGIMRDCVDCFHVLGSVAKAAWVVTAGLDSRPLSGFNAMVSNLASEGQEDADAPIAATITDESADDKLDVHCDARKLSDQTVDNSLTLKLHYGTNPRLLSNETAMSWDTDHYEVTTPVDMEGAWTGYGRVWDDTAERYITGHIAIDVPAAA